MEKRIERVKLRDNTSRDRIKERMAHQWSDDKKKKLADIVLDNKDLDTTKQEVERIHQMLINGNATG
jgi:dephospho-CoA kinase